MVALKLFETIETTETTEHTETTAMTESTESIETTESTESTATTESTEITATTEHTETTTITETTESTESTSTENSEKEKQETTKNTVENSDDDDDDDIYVFPISHGAFTDVPVYCDHVRGRNWLARVKKNPTAPNGLSREYAQKAYGKEFYYIVPKNWNVGDYIECAGDYITASGKNRDRDRWYGIIVEQTEMYWKVKKVDIKQIGLDISVVAPKYAKKEKLLSDDDELILKKLIEKYTLKVIIKYIRTLL